MPTISTPRTIPTTNYNLTRIGGEYLLDSFWNQIIDSYWNPIIVLVIGGRLPFTPYQARETRETVILTISPIVTWIWDDSSTWSESWKYWNDSWDIDWLIIPIYTTRTIP